MSSKLESNVYGLHHMVKATEVTTGLVKINGNLSLGGWLKITCGLTACTCTPGSAPGPTLSNEYGRTFTFPTCVGSKWHRY